MTFDAETLRTLVSQLGYPLVAAIILAENLFLPAPSQTTVLVAGGLAATGALDPFVLAVVVSVSAFVGDNLGFAIGHFGGRPMLDRFGARLGMTTERYATTERLLARYGGPAIVVGRFIAFVRILVPPLLATTGMRWRRFLPWDALAALLWGPTIVALGYFGAAGTQRFASVMRARFGTTGLVVALVVALAALMLVFAGGRLLRRKLLERNGSAVP